MPSPFPGMDPYLESPAEWPPTHTALMVNLTAAINAVLPPGFRARTDERLYIAEWDRQFVPDMTLTRRDGPACRGSGGVATVDRAEPSTAPGEGPRLLRLPDRTVRERYIDIVSLKHPQRRIVTTVELLSPANKARGRGHEEYVRKQRELLDSDVNLLEVDLLRAGEPTLIPPREAITREFGRWDYAACLHRGGAGNDIEVWAWTIRDPLPTLLVPLAEGLPDVRADLQEVFAYSYDAQGLAPDEGYAADPDPPLTGEDTAWADALLKQKGLRAS